MLDQYIHAAVFGTLIASPIDCGVVQALALKVGTAKSREQFAGLAIIEQRDMVSRDMEERMHDHSVLVGERKSRAQAQREKKLNSELIVLNEWPSTNFVSENVPLLLESI
ncbi:hypothetical protein CNO08_04990 [Lysobacter capsici]|nr:hypothetical protein CNO08_04990 [Lysobacter capsici]